MSFIFSMLNDSHSPVVAVTQVVILSTVLIISASLTYFFKKVKIKYVGLRNIFNEVLYF